MGVIQITYNDVQNMIEAASKDKPYLVYSYKLRKMPNPSGFNRIKGEDVIVCWIDEEEKNDKESVALMILPEKESLELHKKCLHVRNNGGKTKFIKVLHKSFQDRLVILRRELEGCEPKQQVTETTKIPETKEVAKLSKKSLKKEALKNKKISEYEQEMKYKMQAEAERLQRHKESEEYLNRQVKQDDSFFPIFQKSFPVTVRKESIGFTFSSPLMGRNYTLDETCNLIITGPCGEEFTVRNTTFKQDYSQVDGSIIDDSFINGLELKKELAVISKALPTKCFAKQLPLDVKITILNKYSGKRQTSNVDGVPHGSGDYLVSDYENNSERVYILVNGLVFEKTYQKLNTNNVNVSIDGSKDSQESNEEEIRKRFETKKLVYKQLQEKLLANPLENYLKRPIEKYTGVASHAIVGYYRRDEFFNGRSDVVILEGKHYVTPFLYNYLINGSVDQDYYKKFKESESLLDIALETCIGYTKVFPEFAKFVDDTQDKLDYESEKEQFEKTYYVNSKTTIGRLKNLLTKNPYA